MIRGLIGFLITIMLIGACLCFMARCTACAVTAPLAVSDTVQAEQIVGRRDVYKNFKRKQKERQQQEERRKQEKKQRPESDDDAIGRPRFILE